MSAGQVLPGGLKVQPSAPSQKHEQSPAAQLGWHDETMESLLSAFADRVALANRAAEVARAGKRIAGARTVAPESHPPLAGAAGRHELRIAPVEAADS